MSGLLPNPEEIMKSTTTTSPTKQEQVRLSINTAGKSHVKKPWIFHLSNEILLEILYFAQTECLSLSTAFPELRRFMVLIVDFSVPRTAAQLNSIPFAQKLKRVSIQKYAISDCNEFKTRPVKIFLLYLDRIQMLPRWFHGSGSSLLGRFLDHRSIVFSSGSLSIDQLCHEKNVNDHRLIDLSSDQLVSMCGFEQHLLDCESLKNKVQPNPLYPPTLDQPGYSLQQLHSQPYSPWKVTTKNFKSLKVFNYSSIFSFCCPSSLRRLELVLSKKCKGTHQQPDECNNPMGDLGEPLPQELFHVRYIGHTVPYIWLPRSYDDNTRGFGSFPGSTFVLENSEWSPESPLGLEVPPERTRYPFERTTGNSQSYSFVRYPYTGRIYHVLRFIGIQDTTLLQCYWKGVVTLHWSRLSPRKATWYFNDSSFFKKIKAPDLRDLIIESTVRRNDDFLFKFATKNLRTLRLISLNDSNTAWDLNRLFCSVLLLLEDIYIERRFSNDKMPSRNIKISLDKLSNVSLSVKRMHIRGYIPLFVFSTTAHKRYSFIKLKTLMLDISLVSKSKSIITEPYADPEEVGLSFPQINFPVLHTLESFGGV